MIRSKKNHGLSKTTEYRSWVCMRFRYYNPKNPAYSRYGGRGIKVCERWLESFENFFIDMGKKPTKKHSLDRIDNNKDYSTDNCKWSDDIEQNRNRRNTLFLNINNIKRSVPEWSEITGISQHSIARRLRNGCSPEECIKPVRITKIKNHEKH